MEQEKSEKCDLCQRVVRRGKNESYHFHSPQGGTICLSCASKLDGISLKDWEYARDHTDPKFIPGPWSRNASLTALPENKRQRYIGRTDSLSLEPIKEPKVKEVEVLEQTEQVEPAQEPEVPAQNPGPSEQELFSNTDTNISPAKLWLKQDEEPEQAIERHRTAGWSLPELAMLEIKVDSESRYFVRR